MCHPDPEAVKMLKLDDEDRTVNELVYLKKDDAFTDTRFSKVTGIPMATLQYRYRNPGTWRVCEIGTILRLVDFNESELKGMKEALLS